MYKKTSICLVIFIIICLGIILNKKEVTSYVFGTSITSNESDYNVYYLKVSDVNINTNNFTDYFNEEVDIISITPYINKIYSNKIKSLLYNFNTKSTKTNIENFENYYRKQMQNIGLIDEQPIYSGIKLDEICLYASNEYILGLLTKYPKILYKYSKTDIYRSL